MAQRTRDPRRRRYARPAGWGATLTAGLILAGSPSAAAEPASRSPLGAYPGSAGENPAEILVRFRDGASRRERGSARRRAGAPLAERLPLDGLQLLDAGRPSEVGRAIATLEHEPGVLYAEPDARRSASATVSNDPYFGSLWGLENRGGSLDGDRATSDADIDAPAAWRITTGSPPVKVAVADTGLAADHPELAPNLWTNAGEAGPRRSNGLDDDRNGRPDDVHGWDFVSDDNDPADDHGHGTHVAGTVAARGGNRRGVAGVAWYARIVPLKVLDDDAQGRLSDVIKAYRYAAAKRVRVVNLSLGGDPPSRAEREALAAAPDTLFVIAAGNERDDNDDPQDAHYPCSYPLANIICVAASTPTDGLADFSSYGRRSVDLAAPGTRILSTQPGNDYGRWSGTSMAAPHVAGTAALIIAAHPRLSVAQVKAALLYGTERRTAFVGRTVTGGRLNARRALDLAAGIP